MASGVAGGRGAVDSAINGSNEELKLRDEEDGLREPLLGSSGDDGSAVGAESRAVDAAESGSGGGNDKGEEAAAAQAAKPASFSDLFFFADKVYAYSAVPHRIHVP